MSNLIKYRVDNGQEISDHINQSRGIGQDDQKANVSGGYLQIPTPDGNTNYAKPGDIIEIDGYDVRVYRQIVV